MWNRGVLVLRVLLQGLTKTEVRIDRVRVDLDGMFEVLGRALAFAKVGKQIGQVDAGAKVVLVESEALFEILHASFEVFELLVAHTSVIESI